MRFLEEDRIVWGKHHQLPAEIRHGIRKPEGYPRPIALQTGHGRGHQAKVNINNRLTSSLMSSPHDPTLRPLVKLWHGHPSERFDSLDVPKTVLGVGWA
jgi:hypothetical protein